jgi:hypothetical protein
VSGAGSKIGDTPPATGSLAQHVDEPAGHPSPKAVNVRVRTPLHPGGLSRAPAMGAGAGAKTAVTGLQARRQRSTELLQISKGGGPSAFMNPVDDDKQPSRFNPTRQLKFQDSETVAGKKLHVLAAEEPLSLAQAEVAHRQLRLQAADRKALMEQGYSGTAGQVLRAIFGEGLNLGLIASFGFNGCNVTAQLLIANAVRERLLRDAPHLSAAEREAVCSTAAFLGASFAAGFGALGASILWAPLGVATAQQLSGAYEIQRQEVNLLFPYPEPYVDRENGITKPRTQYDDEKKLAILARKQCAVQQASFGLDSKKAFVLITGGFWIFHSARVGIAPMEQSPWAEGTQAACSAFLGAGIANMFLAGMKWNSSVTIADERGKAAVGATRKVKLHFVADMAPADKDASAFVAKFQRNWKAFADGRTGLELAMFLPVQGVKLSLAVHAATFPTPMIQAAAAAASENADIRTQVFIKMGATAISYAWALFVLLVYFPAIGAARVRPKAPSDEEDLLGMPGDEADEVLWGLLEGVDLEDDEEARAVGGQISGGPSEMPEPAGAAAVAADDDEDGLSSTAKKKEV